VIQVIKCRPNFSHEDDHEVVTVAMGNADKGGLYTGPFWLLAAGVSTGTGWIAGEYGIWTSLSGEPLREGFEDGILLVLSLH
jgi:hypothetical protein